MSEWRDDGGGNGHRCVREMGSLWADADAYGSWSVYIVDDIILRWASDSAKAPSHGRVDGATPSERLAAAKAAADAWCRTMARAVLAEVGDE